MATNSLSKYAENQFLAATAKRYPLMSEILADTYARAVTVTAGMAEFTPALTELEGAISAWNAGETAIANGKARLPACSFAFDDWMASLTRKPDADSNSLMESWDMTMRSTVAHQGPIYRSLLPQGRETLIRGSREEQLDAIRDLGIRLAGQVGKPVLVALGSTITAFFTAASTLRTAQTQAKAALETAREAQEARRVTAATALYGLIAQGMVTWRADPARVDTLWNVNLLRHQARVSPTGKRR